MRPQPRLTTERVASRRRQLEEEIVTCLKRTPRLQVAFSPRSFLLDADDSVADALGFPPRESLRPVLQTHHPFGRSFETLCARRVYVILRHVANAVAGGALDLPDDAHAILSELLASLQPYRVGGSLRMEHLRPLAPGDVLPTTETTVDATIFTLLTTFEESRRRQTNLGDELAPDLIEEVVAYLKDYLDQVAQPRHGGPADDSVVSWALRVLAEYAPEEAHSRVPAYLERYRDLHAPDVHECASSILPEIYTTFRTQCFALSNYRLILEHLLNRYSDSAAYNALFVESLQLGESVYEACSGATVALLYHKASAVVALTALERGLELYAIHRMVGDGELNTAHVAPLPGYVATDEHLRHSIEVVTRAIEEHFARDDRKVLQILITGPSRSGKTRLAGALALHFGQRLEDTALHIKQPSRASLRVLLEQGHSERRTRGSRVFLLIDECDKPTGNNVYQLLLKLADEATVDPEIPPLPGAVVLYVASRFKSGDEFKQFLLQHSNDELWQSGIDWHNRFSDRQVVMPEAPFAPLVNRVCVLACALTAHTSDGLNVNYQSLVSCASSVDPAAADAAQRLSDGAKKFACVDGQWLVPLVVGESGADASRVGRTVVLSTRGRWEGDAAAAVKKLARRLWRAHSDVSVTVISSADKSVPPEGYAEIDVVVLLPSATPQSVREVRSRLSSMRDELERTLKRRILLETRIGPVKPGDALPGDLVLHGIVFDVARYMSTSPLVQFSWRTWKPCVGARSLQSVASPRVVTAVDVVEAYLGLNDCEKMVLRGEVPIKEWKPVGRRVDLSQHWCRVEGRSLAEAYLYAALRSTCNWLASQGVVCSNYGLLTEAVGSVGLAGPVRDALGRLLEWRTRVRCEPELGSEALDTIRQDAASVLTALRRSLMPRITSKPMLG